MIALDHVSLARVPATFAVDGHRVMLDGAYLEVGHVGEPLLFLRPQDMDEAARVLGTEPRPCHGADGEWLDLPLAGPVTLTRRVDREGWPPRLPGGAALEAVRLRGDAAALLDPLEALGGPPPGLLVDHAPGESLRVVAVVAGGGQLL